MHADQYSETRRKDAKAQRNTNKGMTRNHPILSLLCGFAPLRPAVGVVLLGFMVACAVGPDYKRPDVEAPERYRFDDIQAVASADSAWWAQFGDQQLERLIAIALAESKDILIAAARVEEFYGRYGVQRGQQFPQAGLQAQGGSQQVSRVSALPLPAPASVTSDFYSVDLGVSFEIDLWGRLRRATRSCARRSAGGGGKPAHGRPVARCPQSRRPTSTCSTSTGNSRSRARPRARARSRCASSACASRAARSPRSELQQVTSEYEVALAAIPLLEKQIAQQENGLSVLIGRNPGPTRARRHARQAVAARGARRTCHRRCSNAVPTSAAPSSSSSPRMHASALRRRRSILRFR